MDERKARIQFVAYRSSLSISITALILVALLEIFMIGYSIVNAPFYGDVLWIYRTFYISLLSLAIIYIVLDFTVKKDLERRYKLLHIANPLFAAFFFFWALGITYFDIKNVGIVDATVFITISLIVPLSFFLFPSVYAAIVLIADAIMVYFVVTISGQVALLINTSIFFVFQFVLGVAFMRIRLRLAEKIVTEEENANIDVMTGFPNRRVYEDDTSALEENSVADDFGFIVIDINGLKEVNDTYGHETGDKVIIGAADCIRKCFGNLGKMYRVGGDEFFVMINADASALDGLFDKYEKSLKEWSDENGVELSAAYGFASHSEFPDSSVRELAKTADDRMYAAKAAHYQQNGKGYRRYRL